MTPRELQTAIAADARASARVLSFLDAERIPHSGLISGATLAHVCGVHSRTWRKWAGGEREMPESARRLLSLVAWGEVAWEVGA